MEERFLQVVADSLEVEVDEISMETAYKEYEPWDSMAMLNLLMDLEDEFDVSIPIEKVAGVKTLADVFNIVNGK
ncbi:acyl carrier protein [Ruminococcus sp.]|uniref:acyl carrier protein n=1 Tax=Ruminococcus sp. TaxID=41978 RepID=UPI0015638890|nr:acyl carrier protein [Ruminococcus sp.]MBR1431040.1 acyl carrier protein [Ruminococcus sp.]